MKKRIILVATVAACSWAAEGPDIFESAGGERLFDRETFGGNGRTCLACHSVATGTVSPEDARKRLAKDRYDPLFLHDGSDDGQGNGVSRILKDATIRVEIPLPPNVRLAGDPYARSVVLNRGIPSTLNTPALDPVLMYDGRHPDLKGQAGGAIQDHYQATAYVSERALRLIARFQLTDRFFSSPALRKFALGGPAPHLPKGRTASEKRGRRFFESVPLTGDRKAGSCAACHAGAMLNETNEFFPAPLPPGTRFQSAAVSEFNDAGNPVRKFIFTNPDGTKTVIESPDPGRALITGSSSNLLFDNVNAFKIPSLWGVRETAPYFHDNSSKTLEDLATHYQRFFALFNPPILLTRQDKADIVSYLKLLR
jgi:cytochrome c peroxidase